MAYLNYVVVDKTMTNLASGYRRLTTAARETGTDGAHERLAFDAANKIKITQQGYVYIYLSNENPTAIEVYFDDFKIDIVKSMVIQNQDYYPFGLTFNEFQRESTLGNSMLFQNQEEQDELNLGWSQFRWRNVMPDIGRFFNIDPLSDKYVYNSPYAFSENKVTSHVELEGLETFYAADGKIVGAGPLATEEALSRGAVEYGVLSDEVKTVTEINNKFTDEEVNQFETWNHETEIEGKCIAYAVRGSEKLTGISAGWETKKGNLNVSGKHVWNLGDRLANLGVGVEIEISSADPASALSKNGYDAGSENAVFLVGPAGAGHAIIQFMQGQMKGSFKL